MGLRVVMGRRCCARPDPNPIFQARSRILIHQPVHVRFQPETKNITKILKKLLKKKKSFSHPQSHQLRAIFIDLQGVFFAVFYHISRENPITYRKPQFCSGVRPDNFSKFEPDLKSPSPIDNFVWAYHFCC